MAGCGSLGSDSESDDSAKQTGKKEMDVEGDDVTTLNVWTFIENHQDFYTDMAEKWNEENPDRLKLSCFLCTNRCQHGD